MNTKVRKIAIEDFFKMPQETDFKISPNGAYISYLKPYEKRLNVFVKSIYGGEEIRVTGCEDRNIARYIFANENRIVYMKDNGGDENFRLFAVDIDGTNFKEVAGFESVRADIINDLKDDNDHILISMNKRNKQLFDVYKLNVYTGDMELIVENSGGVDQWLIDNNGELRVGVELDGVNTKILYRETSNDVFRLILEGDYKENAQPLCFTENNKNLIIASNIGRDKYAIYEFDPITKENVKLIYENNEVDVESVITSKKNNRLICSPYYTEKLQYKFFNTSDEEIYNKIKARFVDDCIEFKDINRDENKIIIQAYSDRNPGVYYLYDVKKDVLTKIAEVKPWLNAEEMAEVKPIKYTSRDGLIIYGYLTIPKAVEIKSLPVVVNVHGGPWARDVWGFRGDNQFLANRGYAVLQMNFRASTGYGRKFKEAGFKEWGKAMQDDITDGVNWLIREGIADPNRVAIYGGSYGGYATLAGLTFTPDLYTCGVDVVGPSNIFTLLEGLPAYWEPMRKMMYEMMGDPEVDKDLLWEASPLFHVDNIKKPLFVAQGAKDPRVPQSQADQIVESLRNRNIEVKYMLKENEGHGFRNEENILEMYSEVEKFLEQHIS
jgi:dipeptidyl aminopeptidase/acylaminoacyl peptidase